MKFDYAVGNPPYQENKSSTVYIDIWPDFVKESTKIANKTCMIHPGRWINPKKNMKKTTQALKDAHLKTFNLFPEGKDVFADTNIAGGISITYFDSSYDDEISGYVENEYVGIYDITKLFCTKYESEAYNKVFANINKDDNMLQYMIGNIGSLGTCESGYIKGTNTNKLKDTPDGMKEPIHIRCAKTFGVGGATKYSWNYIEKSDLINPMDGMFVRKVLVNKVGPTKTYTNWGVTGCRILDANEIEDKSLYCIPKNQRESELLLIKSLFDTRTARYLMTIKQKSICCMGFECIPDYLELAKLLPEDELFTDEWFYKTFDFSEGLINEIETRVSPKVDKEA